MNRNVATLLQIYENSIEELKKEARKRVKKAAKALGISPCDIKKFLEMVHEKKRKKRKKRAMFARSPKKGQRGRPPSSSQ